MNDEDRRTYLSLLDELHERWDWRIFSYALMSSHVHQGDLAGQLPLAELFHPLHTRFAASWHDRHGGLGPIFAARPANWEVRPELAGRLIAYQHRNPVEARLVTAPAQSRWTSHRAYLRLDPAPGWLDVELGLSLCGFEDTKSGRHNFDEFVREVDLNDKSAFTSSDRTQSGEPDTVPWRKLTPEEWRDFCNFVTARLGIENLAASTKNRRVVRARRVLAVAACDYLRQSIGQIALELGRTRGSVHHLLNRKPQLVEDVRPEAKQLVLEWRKASGRK